MPVQSVLLNGGDVLNFIPDPQNRDMPILTAVRLGEGDMVVVTLTDGSRRHYRVNEHQRLPPGVRLSPHVTLVRTDPPPPPPPPVDEEDPKPSVEGPSVWERLKKPLLS